MAKVLRYKNIYREIKKRKPTNILEIGTWNGKTANKMLKVASKYVKKPIYYGFDLFEDFTKEMAITEHCPKKPSTFRAVKNLLKKTFSKAQINLIQGNTKETLAKIHLPIMDFIFIDGGHSTETIQSDWENLQKVISKDTVILFDDYYEKIDTKNIGCNTVIKKIQDSSKYSIELLDPVDHLRENNLFIRIVKVNKLN